MSRIIQVIQNKNKVERAQKARRNEELTNLKTKSSFKASLLEELKNVNILLNSNEIDGIIIKIPEKVIARFSEAIYSEELSGYDISQLPNEPDKFVIKYRVI